MSNLNNLLKDMVVEHVPALNDDSDCIYSDNEEVWYQYRIEEAVSNALEQMQHKPTPFDITIYKGKPRKHNASECLPNNLWEQMTDIAYDNIGEHVDNWASKNISKQLNEELAIFIDRWFSDNHDLNFFTVDNIQHVNVRINKWIDDDFEYVIVN